MPVEAGRLAGHSTPRLGRKLEAGAQFTMTSHSGFRVLGRCAKFLLRWFVIMPGRS